MNYQIQIEDLTLKAWVGIHHHEQRYQPIQLNLYLEVSAHIGETYDNIEHTIDYEKLILRIKDCLNRKKFQLLETLAKVIADLLLNDPRILTVRVTASKPEILDCKRISVTVSKSHPTVDPGY